MPENDGEILRWAYPNKMNGLKTYNSILAKKKLMDDSFPFKITKRVFELLEMGLIHISGRDRLYRPIMIIRYNILLQTKPMPEVEEVIGVALMNLMFMSKYMLEDGIIENIIQVGDHYGNKMVSMPFKLLKGIMGFLTQIIRGRARTVFMLNAPKTISFVWNTVRYFLDENT